MGEKEGRNASDKLEKPIKQIPARHLCVVIVEMVKAEPQIVLKGRQILFHGGQDGIHKEWYEQAQKSIHSSRRGVFRPCPREIEDH